MYIYYNQCQITKREFYKSILYTKTKTIRHARVIPHTVIEPVSRNSFKFVFV